MQRTPLAWRLAAALPITAIVVLAIFQSVGSVDIGEALLFVGGLHLVVLGGLAICSASVPLLSGTAIVLLAHQATLAYLLWSEAPDGSLAMGILAILTLPGAAAGAGVARVLEWQKLTRASRILTALVGAIATFSGMAAQLLLS